MSEILELLKSLDRRLATIERFMTRSRLSESLTKSSYSCNEVAELTGRYGIKKYRPFTVRLACKDRRIAEAEKLNNGLWTVPRVAVIRLLNEGIPPEQRNGDQCVHAYQDQES